MSEDDEDDELIGDFRKNLDALRAACRLYEDEPSDESLDEDYDLEDDDDVLLLSIQKRFGTSFSKDVSERWEEAQSTYEEEDDDDILRAVQQRFASLDEINSKTRLISAGKAGVSKYEAAAENHISTAAFDSEAGDAGNFKTFSTQETQEFEVCGDVSPSCDVILSPPVCDNKGLCHKGGFSLPGQVEIFDDTIAGELVDGNISEINFRARVFDEVLSRSTRSTLDALKKNRLCQKVLRSKLLQIQSKLKENVELKKQVTMLLDFNKICRRRFTCFREQDTKAAIRILPTVRKKQHDLQSIWGIKQMRRGPADNEDVAKLRAVQNKFCVSFEPRIWSKEEKGELVKGVKQQVQESRIRSAMDCFSAGTDVVDLASLDGQIKGVAEKPLTPADIQAALPKINWNDVARVYVAGRSPMECKIQWSNHEDPLINRAPWTKMEDKRLWSIARQHRLCNWDLVSQELGTCRTVAQCLIRYQRSLNAGIIRSSWTLEEDENLRTAVEQYGDQDWSTVAASLEGRTGSQCWNRWYKILNPMRQKSGRWDVMEDKRLKLAVSVYGPRMWKTIAKHVSGRTEVQCRERWCNVLDPSLKLEEWTEEEDKRLEEAVLKHGQHHWSAVANELRPRTDNQCWRRWKHTHPEHLMAFRKDVEIQKVALMSNFVGRRKERSRLSPSDFIPQRNAHGEYGGASMNRSINRLVKKPRNESLNDVHARYFYHRPMKVTPECAKINRAERIQKIRLARAAGKMQCWKRVMEKSGPDHGDSGNRKPLRRGGKSAESHRHRKDGTAAFIRLVRQVACFCHSSRITERNVEGNASSIEGSSCLSMFPDGACETNVDDQGRVGTDLTHVNSGTEHQVTGEQNLAETRGNDEEIETAVKAVLSWPFFLGLQEIWKTQPEQI